MADAVEYDMNDRKIRELRENYKTMEDEALIAMVSIDNLDYEPGAIELAKAELASRNISLSEQAKTTDEISQQRKQEQEKIENKPLSTRQKVIFIALPMWAWWYATFAPKEWIKRRREAKVVHWIGLALWFCIFSIFCLIYRR